MMIVCGLLLCFASTTNGMFAALKAQINGRNDSEEKQDTKAIIAEVTNENGYTTNNGQKLIQTDCVTVLSPVTKFMTHVDVRTTNGVPHRVPREDWDRCFQLPIIKKAIKDEKATLRRFWGSCGDTRLTFRERIMGIDSTTKEFIEKQSKINNGYDGQGSLVMGGKDVDEFRKIFMEDVKVGTMLNIAIHPIHVFTIEKQVVDGQQFWSLQQAYMGHYDAFWWAGIDVLAPPPQATLDRVSKFREQWGLGQNIYDKREVLCNMLCELLSKDDWFGVDIEHYWNRLPFLPSYKEDQNLILYEISENKSRGAGHPMLFLVQVYPLGSACDDYRQCTGETLLTQGILMNETRKLCNLRTNPEEYLAKYLRTSSAPKTGKRKFRRRGGRRKKRRKTKLTRLANVEQKVDEQKVDEAQIEL